MNPAPRSLDPRLTQPTMHVQSNSLLGSPTFHANESAYTLATVQHESDESSSLLSSSSHLSSMSTAYGTTPIHPPHQTRRVIFNATLKMAAIFFVSCIVLGGILWVALPTLDPYVTSVLLLLSLFLHTFALPRSEKIARYFTYRSLFPTFRISITSSRNTATYIPSVLWCLMSSLTSCGYFRSVPFSPVTPPPPS